MSLTKPKAEQIEFIPSGGITSTNLQAALNELDSDKINTANLAAPSGSSLVGYMPAGTGAVATTVEAKLREIVSVKDFGADPTGATDSTVAIQNALNSLTNGGTVFVPAGTYSVKSVTIPYSYTALLGAENNATKFVSPAGRWGQTIVCNDKDFVSVKNITIDNNLAEVEGGLWFGGVCNSIIENCRFLNGDQTSMAISGAGGASGGTRVASNNIVRDCYAKGQKSYHPNGTSPFIAGNNAQRTTFINCVAEDCEADAFDADQAPFTRFVNCTAKKSGARSAFAGFWSEFTETNTDGYSVTWENCYSEGFVIGFGSSENVQPTLKNPTVKNCTRAVWFKNTGRAIVKGGLIDACGDAGDNTGAVLVEDEALIDGVTFQNTEHSNAIAVYSGTAKASASVHITNCSVDKRIAIGYANTGPMNVRVSGCTLNGTTIYYFDCGQKNLIVDRNIFISGGIGGARIKNSVVTVNTFIDQNASPTLTAIALSLDTFNTYFNDNTFIGYLNITDNGTAGKNNYLNCTNLPEARGDYLVKKQILIISGGTNYSVAAAARGSYLLLVHGNGNDQATGAYIIQGTSYTTDHAVTVLAEKPDFGTTNKFIVSFPNGGPIQITHPISGRVANCVLVAYDF